MTSFAPGNRLRHSQAARPPHLCMYRHTPLRCGHDGLDRWYCVMLALLLDELSDQPSPAGLMVCHHPRAIVNVEVLVEQHIVAPLEIALEALAPAAHGPPAIAIAHVKEVVPGRAVGL